MATASERIKLGMFIAAAAALLLAVIAIFAGVRFFSDRDQYSIRFPGSVVGLEKGSAVLLRGVNIGSVVDIEIPPDDYDHVEVTIGVDEGTVIKTDATAALRFKGVTGLKLVEIRGGTQEAETLPPGSRIPPGEAGLEGLVDDADRIASKTEKLLDNLLVITGPENQARVTALLETGNGLAQRMDAIVAQVAALTDETRNLLRTSLVDTSAQMNELLASADALVDEARTSLGKLELEESAAELRATMANLNQVLASFEGAVGGGGQQLTATLRNVARASRNLEELSRSLRENPSRILFDRPPEPRELP